MCPEDAKPNDEPTPPKTPTPDSAPAGPVTPNAATPPSPPTTATADPSPARPRTTAPVLPIASDAAPAAERKRFGSAWTGGQWSFVRVLFSIVLLGHLARALDRGGELMTANHVAVAVGGLATLFIALGSLTKFAATVALAATGLLAWRAPFAAPARMMVLALPLLALMLAPAAPFGSRAARSRIDPDGGWRLPKGVFVLLWLGVAVSCAWSTLGKITSPHWQSGEFLARSLERGGGVPEFAREFLLALPPQILQILTWAALGAGLLFAPLALLRVTRPLAWGVLLACHLFALPITGLHGGHLEVVAALFFLFDPAWFPPRTPPATGRRREDVFFDGHCGLCHRLVRFLLSEDRRGLFTFSPLQGQAVRGILSEHARAGLPDSVVLVDRDNETHVKSDAVLRIYDSLGGIWRVVAGVLRVIPRPLRDLGYDLVAAVRHRLFARPPDSCPLMPPSLKDRFAP